MASPTLAFLLLWLAAVAWSDWRSLRVPNTLLAGAAVFLLLTSVAGVHPRGLPFLHVVTAALAALVLALPLFAKGWIGAGDAKLFAVLAGFFGFDSSLVQVWAYAAVLAGMHVTAWRALLLLHPGLPVAVGARGLVARRTLPHGAHLALAAAGVLLATRAGA